MKTDLFKTIEGTNLIEMSCAQMFFPSHLDISLWGYSQDGNVSLLLELKYLF